MPLNRPALSLGPGPRGVQDARRWVVDVCTDIGRPELIECAELGVSELVTNALLHGRDADHGAGARHPASTPASRSATPRRSPRCCRADARSTTDDDDLLRHLRPRPRRSWPAARPPGAPRSRRTARSSGSRPPPSPRDDPVRRRRSPAPPRAEDRAARRARGSSRSSCTASRCASSSASRRTTASCAARSGCWPWRTRTTTRWPRPSPTTSAPWTASCSEGIGAYQIDEAVRSRRNRTDLRVAIAEDGAATVGPVPRAARPRRRLLPRAAPAVAGALARSSARSSAGSSASSSASRPARRRSRGTTRGRAPPAATAAVA